MKNQFVVEPNRSNHGTCILIADDFSEWRAQVRKILQARPEWTNISEASNGKEAVEKATETQPDIILLDLGMPGLNGIEAAKVIRERCPKSAILFVTQDSDADIKNAAIGVGAAGYVRKIDAGNELLDAITKALNR